MTVQSVEEPGQSRTPRPTPLLVRQAKQNKAARLQADRESRAAAEQAAVVADRIDFMLRLLRQETLECEERLLGTLEVVKTLAPQGIEVLDPPKNIGRVFCLKSEDMSLRGNSLEEIARKVAAYTGSVLGPDVKVRLKFPELSYDRPCYWTSPYDGMQRVFRPLGTRKPDQAFMAPLVEVEIVDPKSSDHLLVEALTFPCLAGFTMRLILEEAFERGREVFGEVKLRITGLLPIAPEGTTWDEVWSAASNQGHDVIEAALAEMLPKDGFSLGFEAPNVTVEVVD